MKKGQMDKMALEARQTGQLQVWISRREVDKDLHKHASKRGILVLENVKTGRSPAGNEMSAKEAMDKVRLRVTQAAQRRAIAGGTALAFGASLAARYRDTREQLFEITIDSLTESTLTLSGRVLVEGDRAVLHQTLHQAFTTRAGPARAQPSCEIGGKRLNRGRL